MNWFGMISTLALTSSVLAGCGVEQSSESWSTNEERLTFEEFKAETYKEPFEDGLYIVDGDMPVLGDKHLREIYDEAYPQPGALIVDSLGGQPAIWGENEKTKLTYCISNNFGSLKSRAIEAMNIATSDWEAAANVDFIYVSSEDANCDQRNNNVLFDVRGVSGAPYSGRAFFPGDPRRARNVIVSDFTFSNQVSPDNQIIGVLRHELGHVLGFRHEHTRPGAPAGCFEDSRWFEVTDYDRNSIMHYPECNGTNRTYDRLSNGDIAGAAAVYGEPNPSGSSTPSIPEPTPTGSEDPIVSECSGSDSRGLAQGEVRNFQPIFAEAGRTFTVQLQGTGDADLYVGVGSAPTDASFTCRPFLEGSRESCSVTIPDGGAEVFIRVVGFADSNYQMNATWGCEG